MFGTRNQELIAVAKDGKSGKVSVICEGLNITGDITGDVELLIDGTLEGNIHCRAVTIGESGHVAGRIDVQELIIQGRVDGNVKAKLVRLRQTAVMLGDVEHEILEVQAGAKTEGRYVRTDGERGAAPARNRAAGGRRAKNGDSAQAIGIAVDNVVPQARK